MIQQPKSIVILGGGSAGWMAANTFLHCWPQVKITLVESADIGTVGVGEGATPYLKQYFKTLNIAESEWMPACDATYKVGISFEKWSTQSGYEDYFHPFFSHLDKPPAELFFHNCGLRRRGVDADALPDHYFVAAELAKQKRNPTGTGATPLDIDYAYHFDAAKLGCFLRDKAVQKGLRHIVDTVTDVAMFEQQIAGVRTQKSGLLNADLYVDCSGFAGRLIHQALGQQYRSYSDVLFNDAAVAIQTPRNRSVAITPKTRSVALSNGWMWQIPLTSRQGNGYVYSKDFISADQAETELRATLGIEDKSDVKVRHLSMRVGRLEQHWAHNCLAVGLSQGFIEPLEATALMLTQLTVERFTQVFDQAHQKPHLPQQVQDEFNEGINQVFDGIRDYIVAHYKLNTRQDSAYWRENAANNNTPEALQAIMQAWDAGEDVEQVLKQHQQSLVYLRPSWYCILAGMGRFPSHLKPSRAAAPVEQAIAYCQDVSARYFSAL